MKFLIIAPRFHTNLYYRVKALQNAGHSIKIIVLYKGESEHYDDIVPIRINLSIFSNLIIKITTLLKKSKLKSSFELRFQSPNKEFKKIITNYKPDVILLKAYQNALAIKTLQIAKKRKIKVLMLTQTNFTHIKGSTFLFKLNIILFKYLKVWAYITPIKSNYEVFKNFGIKNVFYLPFVYPVNKKNNKIYNENLQILSVGKFQKRKDQLLLLNAFNELIKEKYKINLCLIGEVADEKYYKEITGFVLRNNISEHVYIKSNLSYSLITEEYKKHNIFVLPAYSEPAAYSPVEALANGMPVICSNENGTKCYIKEGENGYIFEAKNKRDLKEKIKLFISNKEKLREMSEYCLSSAIKNHNLKDFEQEIIKIIKLQSL